MNRRHQRLGPRNKTVQASSGLPWLFTDKAVTAWGGLRLMQEFLTRLHFRDMLTASPLPQPLSNRGYSPVLMVESFLVAVWVGGVHFAHTALVRFDAALCEMFGWSQVASVATFTRFFRRFRQSTNQAVSAHWAHWLWQQVPSTTLTLDLDSSVLTRYGTQEGAAKGYNPQKKGRLSHHPLFAFVADLRMVLHAWLRPGNTADSSGLTTFFDEAVAPLGGRHRIGLVRADAGFCSNTVLTHFETHSLNYIVAGRLLPGLRLILPGLRAWTAVDRGLAVTDVSYQAQGWPHARRIVVVRQEVLERPQAQGKLLKEVPGYRYQLLVTNLTLPPVEVWRLYRHRADSENRIAELKQDFGLTGFCLDSFWGTEAAFQTVLLAYNLMSVFRQALLRAPRAVKLATMRVHCFALGAWVGRQGRRKVLRISVPPQRRAWFEGLFARLEGFHSPWPITGSNV